jgi:hypothetical protein
MKKQDVFKRLEEEVIRSGKTKAEFIAELDKSARPKVGLAYAFGLVTAAYTGTFNNETVCRYIREWKKSGRVS